MKITRYLWLFISTLFVLTFPLDASLAQNEQDTLEIRLNRDFGYAGFGNDIQGLFTLKATGPERLERVEYQLDGETIGSANEAPFRFQFQTDNYPPGVHTISAIGNLNDAKTLNSNEIVTEFVSSTNARTQTITIAGTIIVIVLGGMVLAAVIPILLGRKSKSSGFQPQNYGMMGGAVCPKCGKPFARHPWGLNLVVGKLDRCPHCGKWSLVARATPDQLRFAEENLQKNKQPELPISNDGDQLQRDVENSKYLD